MGVEIIKDRFGEDQFVLSNEDFHNDDVMGEHFSDYQIMKIIKNRNKIFVAKVMSKQNSKIYVLKQLEVTPDFNQMKQEFEMRRNLQHPNIIKYYKWFNEGSDKTYMVTEYMDNGDLDNFIQAYKSLKKPIDTNTLWNIFMQCMAALEYLHRYNIIHGKISLKNVLMNEGKVIKLDDIKFSFIKPKDNEYMSPEYKNNIVNYTADIYAMGKVFKKLISVVDEKVYPLEMRQIVDLMINQYKTQNTSYLYNQIMDHYIKNVARVSSINAVLRCMSSFQDFSYAMFQNQNRFSENQTPVSFYYMQCLTNYMNNLPAKDTIRFYNNIRNLLFQNSQMNNDVEIKPKQILEFLLEKLNKETGSNFRGASFGTQNMFFDNDKNNAYAISLNYFTQNFDSIISRFFIGLIKTKRLCFNGCKKGFYSFNLHPFIEFDLDMVQGEPNIENWFYLQNNKKVILNTEHKIICPNCNMVRDFREFKQFYNLPKCFIISLNRGENYKNIHQPQIPLFLDLTNKIETRDCPTQFNLVGIVKRSLDEKNEEHFIAIYKDKNNRWKKSEREKVEDIMDPLADKDGLVIMLFYSAIIQIGQ